MKQEFRSKVIFQLISLLSLTFIAIYAIFNIALVGLKQYQSRTYFLGMVIWCFITGAVQVGYLLYSVIMNFKQKKPFYYLLTIQAASSTLISMILLMTEYFVFKGWYRNIEIQPIWNGAISYSILSIILGLFLANWILTLFILWKTRPIEDLEEDIL